MNTSFMSLIDSFRRLRVTVIGESILDSYLTGSPRKLCREAPVPSVAIETRSDACGGAANTAANAAALGSRVEFLSVTGTDPEGGSLRALLRRHGVSLSFVIDCPGRRTLTKSRIIASSQMLVRFDQGSTGLLEKETEAALAKALHATFRRSDAVIVSDYGCGLFTGRIIKTIAGLNASFPRVVVADSRALSRMRMIAPCAVKPNYEEAAALLGIRRPVPAGRRAERIGGHGKRLLALTGARICAITLDRDGALIVERGLPSYRTYSRGTREISTTGAGDTFTAALALSLAAGADGAAAGELASAAAGVVIAKDTTASCSSDELRTALSTGDKFIPDPECLGALCAAYRARGMRVVFTNGCFDILHTGHITHLNRSKELGDLLVVGVNSDRSVARLKGGGRPIVRLADRIRVLSALSCVDHIAVFEEDTAEALIARIRPHIFTKGGTYTPALIPEAGLLRKMGIEVRVLPYVEDYSTAKILRQVRELA